MLFVVRKMIFYPFIFLQSCNTIARAERIRIKPISDYKMGCLLLALVKAFCQETFSKKTRANLACEFATFFRESGKSPPRVPSSSHPRTIKARQICPQVHRRKGNRGCFGRSLPQNRVADRLCRGRPKQSADAPIFPTSQGSRSREEGQGEGFEASIPP